mmetsp:Transcript_61380/g.109477  ORF Transcript_61380/g.109477 Transcript_61380/m.109477 type:complete len:232 (-) Transcript_61380:131-826(-)
MSHGAMPSWLFSVNAHALRLFQPFLLLLLLLLDVDADRDGTIEIAAGASDQGRRMISIAMSQTPTSDSVESQEIQAKYVEMGGPPEKPTALDGAVDDGRIQDLFTKTGDMSERKHKCPPKCDTYSDTWRVADRILDKQAVQAMQRARNQLSEKSRKATDLSEDFAGMLQNLAHGMNAYHKSAFRYSERERDEHQDQMKRFWKAMSEQKKPMVAPEQVQPMVEQSTSGSNDD